MIANINAYSLEMTIRYRLHRILIWKQKDRKLFMYEIQLPYGRCIDSKSVFQSQESALLHAREFIDAGPPF